MKPSCVTILEDDRGNPYVPSINFQAGINMVAVDLVKIECLYTGTRSTLCESPYKILTTQTIVIVIESPLASHL